MCLIDSETRRICEGCCGSDACDQATARQEAMEMHSLRARQAGATVGAGMPCHGSGDGEAQKEAMAK